MTNEEKKKFQVGLQLGLQMRNEIGSSYKVVSFINWLNPINSWCEDFWNLYRNGYTKIVILYDVNNGTSWRDPDSRVILIVSKTDYYTLDYVSDRPVIGSSDCYYCYVYSKDYNIPILGTGFNTATHASGAFATVPPCCSYSYISRIWSNCGWGEPLPFDIDELGNVVSYTADTNYLNGFSVGMAINYL